MAGKCVECFKKLPDDEIICDACQADLDGWYDHLKEIKNEE